MKRYRRAVLNCSTRRDFLQSDKNSERLITAKQISSQDTKGMRTAKCWGTWQRGRLSATVVGRMASHIHVSIFSPEEHYHPRRHNFTCSFIWEWNLVCHVKGRTHIGGAENGALKRIFGSKRGLMIVERTKLRNEVMHNLKSALYRSMPPCFVFPTFWR